MLCCDTGHSLGTNWVVGACGVRWWKQCPASSNRKAVGCSGKAGGRQVSQKRLQPCLRKRFRSAQRANTHPASHTGPFTQHTPPQLTKSWLLSSLNAQARIKVLSVCHKVKGLHGSRAGLGEAFQKMSSCKEKGGKIPGQLGWGDMVSPLLEGFWDGNDLGRQVSLLRSLPAISFMLL